MPDYLVSQHQARPALKKTGENATRFWESIWIANHVLASDRTGPNLKALNRPQITILVKTILFFFLKNQPSLADNCLRLVFLQISKCLLQKSEP